ncbi:MAG: L-fucose/L-arabinose isomerase family protein [Anaerolineales bacterium]|nr:L-fucose/L-arabinose isomerase family protein [Anaerolineales bacterium]
MELTDVTLGLVPLARPTFDLVLATQIASQVCSQLKEAGYSLAGRETLVSSLDEAKKVAQELADNPPDLLLIFQATFADSTMVMSLAQAVDAPLLLWAVPEERTGGRLRLNSLCGINLAAHALTRAGYGYDYVYAAPDDATALEKVHALAQAGRARRLLRRARVGVVGEPPTGLDTCRYDDDALERHLGLELVHVDLGEVFRGARTADPQEIEAVWQRLISQLDGLPELDQTALRGTLATYLTLRQLAEQENLDGLAVRCWPEFFTELGCAACGAMSMLSDELTPCSCEADVNGTITQLILQWLSGEPAFGTDLVSVDVEEDVAVLWHCGLAPLSMADPSVRPRGTIHSNRQLPLLMEFPLKPGRVTVARLSEASGSYRLVVGGGEMVRAPLSFTGTSGVLRFDRPAVEVLDVILREGLEHHLSFTYGDYVPALLALARILELPVLRL